MEGPPSHALPPVSSSNYSAAALGAALERRRKQRPSVAPRAIEEAPEVRRLREEQAARTVTWGVDAFDATPVLAPAAPKATFTFGKLVEMVEQRRASTHRLPAAGTWEDDEDGPEPSYLDPSSIAGLFEGSAAAPKDRRKVIADAIAYVNRRS